MSEPESPDQSGAAGEGPPPGSEGYSLEVPREDAPLGGDPPAPWPPCPACGAPRRLPEPVCLQCGHDERIVVITRDEESGEVIDSVDAKAEPAIPPRGIDDADSNRDDELEPLLRPWFGGTRLPWISAAVLLAALVVGGVVSTSAFPPTAEAAENAAVDVIDRVGLTIRLVVAAGCWAVAAWGVCLGFAWGQDRPVGGRVELGGRLLMIAAASRFALFTPIDEPLLSFAGEGLLALGILALGIRCTARVTWMTAAGLAAATAFAIGSAALVAKVLSWVLA